MKLFHYDSKLMQTLMFVGDLMILNIIYVICCLPIFTIGAAQAGLYSGVRVLNNPEDDSSAAGAFFKGFRNGFGKVTVGWGLMALLGVAAALGWYFCSALQIQGVDAPVWMTVVSFCFLALFQSLVPLFHSRFDCKPLQLIRNCWFLLIAHPLRCLAVGVLMWIPFAFFLYDPFSFLSVGMVWLVLYYAVAALFGDLLMRKPFKTLIDHFNETHQEAKETEQEETLQETDSGADSEE